MEIDHTHSKAIANGFMLRVADAILNSSLSAAAETFGSSKYTQFTPRAYAAEIEEAAKEQAKKAAAQQKSAAQKPKKVPDTPPDATKRPAVSDVTPKIK